MDSKKIKKYSEFFLNYIQELIFPKFCIGCRLEGVFLCQDCRHLIEISEYNYCLCNKDPVRLPLESRTGKCNRCSSKRISGLYFAMSYKKNALAKKIIQQFKYPPYTKELAGVIAGIIAEHLFLAGNNENQIWEDSALIPVPVDKTKIKVRNYNQSEEIAKELSKIINIPVLTDVLLKIRNTEPQINLNKEDREKNLLGAFLIKNPEKISGKKVFLLDDVYTTGSTMEECAKMLKSAGVKTVWGIAAAREE